MRVKKLIGRYHSFKVPNRAGGGTDKMLDSPRVRSIKQPKLENYIFIFQFYKLFEAPRQTMGHALLRGAER
jgi:hypothetical protein